MEQKITIPEGYELQKVNDSEYRIVKKESKLPESWKEFCKINPLKKGESWIGITSKIQEVNQSNGRIREQQWFNLLPNKEYAGAILTLGQLIQLRDCYRQGWKPNYKNSSEDKYCIEFFENEAVPYDYIKTARIFSFQSVEIRDKFYENFKDLIEKTKPLFM